jgi:hypothetical protein
VAKIPMRRHAMRFDFGGPRPTRIYVNVKPAKNKTPIFLSLREEDVVKAITLHGIGDTQRCAMACCVDRLKTLFPHKVIMIDWSQSRAHVVTKVKSNQMPSECVPYRHRSSIAEQFDRGVAGHRKVISAIRAAGGELVIKLTPVTTGRPKKKEQRSKNQGSHKPLTAAERASRSLPRGAVRRIARAMAAVTGEQRRIAANI